MRIAIIDLGTNTFHLLIADVDKQKAYTKIFVTRATVKLGKGGIGKNVIAPAPFKRGLKVMSHFHELMRKHKVHKVFAFATSGIRSAVNGIDFIRDVRKSTGI